MNYPVWDLSTFGGGFWIAFIAVIHVYVAHFAVGGGFFLVITEMWAAREDSSEILAYVKKHTQFFLLLSVVFGAVTGVGIWFTISLLSPAGTSSLIHTFVFAFATEWVFFLGEIIAIFIYYYTFDKMAPKQHQFIGWCYVGFGWLSLFTINGIVSFMLTPGDWLTTHNFWDAFFNPTFSPALFFRTFMALMLAGLFGFVTSVYIKGKPLRDKMLKYCAVWLILPMILLVLSAFWYAAALPEAQTEMMFSLSPEIMPFLKLFTWLTPVIMLTAIFLAIRFFPVSLKKVTAFCLIIMGLLYMGSFEWMREAARKPYIIFGYTFSNSINTADLEAVTKTGILKSARWVSHKEITPENQMTAGQEIFRLMCSPCHSVGGPINDILPVTKKYPVFAMDAMINGMGKIDTYMPIFPGTKIEREALAAYIVKGLHDRPDEKTPPEPNTLVAEKIPPFNADKDEYILLAWNNTGMQTISDSDPFWSIQPPGNTIYAQLIRRGELPELVTDDVIIEYSAPPEFAFPARHVSFWSYAESLFGKTPQLDTGLTGNGLKGEMAPHPSENAFIAEMVPVVPYPENAVYNPYPVFTVTAREADSGDILATAKTVVPVSTEMGCRNCHNGNWRIDDRTGIGAVTSSDILAVHDEKTGTTLLEQAENGSPKACKSCHTPDDPKILNLSASIHGFHANYLAGMGDAACHTCHPSSPDGATRSFRGFHNSMDFSCSSCHGRMEDHALALLINEKKTGKERAETLLKYLSPKAVKKISEINPRKPWVNEPDCLHCHINFEMPDTDEVEINSRTTSESGLFRNRTDDAGIMCAACHGITHAVYPAENPFSSNRDVLQPMQYQGNAYPIGANKNCRLCHTIDMEDEMHHPNTLTMFRNTY